MPRRRRPARPGALADLAPGRILTQIALLQLLYYMAAIILIVFTTFVAGRHPEPGIFFDWRQVRGDVTTGWTLGLCWVMAGVITVIPILLLIARSKLVPDFALTIHFVHLLITSFYSRSLPTSVYWWFVQAASAGLMVSLGMWACQWRELQPMAFGALKGKQERGVNGRAGGGGDGEGEGHEMGTLRGEGRDGAGRYEGVARGEEGSGG